jgi:hypothetical protein
MPFGVQRGWMRYALPRPEILAYPLSTNVIDSVVLNSSGVAPDASGPYMNRRYLIAGTVLSKRPDNTYEQYTGATDVATGQVQSVTLVGPPTGGTFALGLHGATTGPLAYNISAVNLGNAIGGLPSSAGGAAIGAGNVTVTVANDANGQPVYTVTLAAAVGEQPIMAADPTLLTGPGNQDAVVQEVSQEIPAGAQNVAGILFDTVEFADGSELSDEPVAMLRRNVSFQSLKIVGFAAHQAAITSALPSCEFL